MKIGGTSAQGSGIFAQVGQAMEEIGRQFGEIQNRRNQHQNAMQTYGPMVNTIANIANRALAALGN